MMKLQYKKKVLLVALLFILTKLFSQGVIISDETPVSGPLSSSILELRSTSLGFLPSRMTTEQRNNITAPDEGLTIYNLTTKCLEVFNGTTWYNMCLGCTLPPQPSEIAGLTQVCEDAILIEYSVDPEPNTDYIWEVPEGWSFEVGQAPNQIRASAGANGGYIRVTPGNECGTGQYRELEVSVLPLHQTPVEGNHVSFPCYIEWHWEPMEGATGYLISESNDINDAVDTEGQTYYSLRYTEGANLVYAYLWSYNECGVSSSYTTMQATTLGGWCPIGPGWGFLLLMAGFYGWIKSVWNRKKNKIKFIH